MTKEDGKGAMMRKQRKKQRNDRKNKRLTGE